jgi:hypothetical protein
MCTDWERVSMVSRSDTSDEVSSGAAAVATALMAIIGVVLAFAAVRYAAGDARKLFTGLGSVFGIVTGSALAYLFMRSAVRARNRRSHDGKSAGHAGNGHSKELHNRLTKVLGALPPLDSTCARPD